MYCKNSTERSDYFISFSAISMSLENELTIIIVYIQCNHIMCILLFF